VTSNNATAKNIAIFASGGGSNAAAIIEHFKDSKIGKVQLIVTNNSSAYVITRAQDYNIPYLIIDNISLTDGDYIINELKSKAIDLVVLAGFLKQIPPSLIDHFPNKILNIHPALLPSYGGKGMYGKRVHQAVFDDFTLETGITIHYVNEAYDEGQIIEQKRVELELTDTPNRIAAKVLKLEHEYYPHVIEQVLIENV